MKPTTKRRVLNVRFPEDEWAEFLALYAIVAPERGGRTSHSDVVRIAVAEMLRNRRKSKKGAK